MLFLGEHLLCRLDFEAAVGQSGIEKKEICGGARFHQDIFRCANLDRLKKSGLKGPGRGENEGRRAC